ncbi:histidine kinase [Streptomyces sp. NPDC048606]|uniref:sensor histidine kinase n=1 Tax=Streptomyces sp. NPDC048606 TaxID=3154726 RepID=UPI003427573B
MMPYVLLSQVCVTVGTRADAFNSLPLSFVAYGAALPLVAITGLLGLIRPLAVAAVRSLCGVPGVRPAEGPARSWAARWRASAWWTAHLGIGALVSASSLAVPPMAVVLLALPFVPALRDSEYGFGWLGFGDAPWVAPLIGAGLLVALALCCGGAGMLLSRLAPVLLGPTAADRLAAAEERAADLAVRNRLARELHDAVGHALSAVALQAAAARRVLDTDPEFVREALDAIRDTTRRTVGELDAVLGLLRDGDPARGDTAPAPTLATDLDGLLARTRAGGTVVAVRQDPGRSGDWARLPAITSREAYRIVQEGLSNALRHGSGPVALDIGVHLHDGRRELGITLTNPLARSRSDPGADGPERTTGGRGLRGAVERAVLLGGRIEAGPYEGGPYEGGWRLRATLPLGADTDTETGTGTDTEAATSTATATGRAGTASTPIPTSAPPPASAPAPVPVPEGEVR